MQMIRTDEITGLWTYLGSIDWSEPWFLGLGAFHLICIAATVLTRNHASIQGIIFAFYLVIVGCSEYINEFAANHWKVFARQQYFDSNGLFISVVMSVPLLINCIVIVVIWLKTSASLMAAIRTKQLQQKQAQKDTKESAGTTVGQSSPENKPADGVTSKESLKKKKEK
ncbi:transmembrane protein 18-like [Pomacea canaliculata]|uniref:transmembrane protein 18-like n=1 Tax=Pomacea canaliculata TaxID=400727 RepID=UPI000D737FA8|nr:transmembrane protein 18-like [Pomacea canaliculata]XP_025090420.1 transmembrane protein 18-like [Pomacea canaliculata]